MSNLSKLLKAKRKLREQTPSKPEPILVDKKTGEGSVKVAVHEETSSKPSSNKLRGILDKAREHDNPKKFSEIARICGLPTSYLLDDAESEEVSRMLVQADSFDAGWRLFDTQTSSVITYQEIGGLFGPIGVGWGKTLVTLLISSAARAKGIEKIVLFVPPSVYPQLWSTDIPAARKRVVLNTQFHGLGGKEMGARLALARSGRKGVYIMPYSLLSTKDSNELLRLIGPGLIIADEAHNLKNRKAARTKRVMEYVEENQPEFVALSGTITDRSIMDYWHLIKICLGRKMPLPTTQIMAAEWSQVLDAKASPSKKQTGPIRPLVDWARDYFPEEEIPFDVSGFRSAFRLRLQSAPGVVATSDQEIGVSLNFRNHEVEYDKDSDGASRMTELVKQIEEMWLTPNGDEIEHAIHTHKWLFELTTGFYNELTWPDPKTFAKRKGIDEETALSILDGARDHHGYLNEYHRMLRQWLDSFSRDGLDTPLLVGLDIARNGAKNVGPELADAWREVKDADFQGRPDRDSSVVRVCDFKIKDAVRVAKSWKNEGGILWYYHQGIGKWLQEACVEAGLDCLFCPAGDLHNKSIIDLKNKNKIVIASISAHGEGKNLQHFHNQLFVQWYRNCKKAEQVLGRLHRNGQEADELFVQTNRTLEWDHDNFGATLINALYVHQTTGNRQKLVYGNYDPMPVVIPPEILRERGFNEVKMLSSEQREMMKEKFGQKT